MIINVDKEAALFIKELISAALKSPLVNDGSVDGIYIFKHSIKLIEEPCNEKAEELLT